MTPKLSQHQKSELKETKKIKDIQLHELTPNQFLSPTPNPQKTYYGSKKYKTTQKLSQHQKSELKEL